jgi:hypothetical protein
MVTVATAKSGKVVIRGIPTTTRDAVKALGGWAWEGKLNLENGQEAVWLAPAHYLKAAQLFAERWNREHPVTVARSAVRRRTFTGVARALWCDDCDDGIHCDRCACCSGE